MSVNFEELGSKLAIAVKESPGYGETDLELQKQYRTINAQRIWELWCQVQLFDPRDQFYNFAKYSGLPDSVTRRYMEVCGQYQAEINATRQKLVKKSRKTSSQ